MLARGFPYSQTPIPNSLIRRPALRFGRRKLPLLGRETAHELVELVVRLAGAARQIVPLRRGTGGGGAAGAGAKNAGEPVLGDRVACLRRALEPAARRC